MKKDQKKLIKKSVSKKPARKKPVTAIIKAPLPAPHEIIQNLVLKGDISGMSPDEKVKYYTHLCKSLGLNPLTQPFDIITFPGKNPKTVLYATKSATEQLRKINGISIEDIYQRIENNICITTVTVKDRTGRTDGATGAVNIKDLSGNDLCNAFMKSETKAKRRATLSISGLGFLDESEIETVSGATTTSINIQEPTKLIDLDEIYRDFEKRINDVTNLRGLITIGEEIKRQSLPDEMTAELREKFSNKLKTFKTAEGKNE